MGWLRVLLVALVGTAVVAGLSVAWIDRAVPIAADARPSESTPTQVARGELLARAGNCAACHTARGGAPYAGGRVIDTPFGTVYAGNLTPDAATGLGRWSADHFWRALHHGRGFDGRRLVPAFPYPQFTRITRDDSDALYAFLRTLPPVSQPNPGNMRCAFPSTRPPRWRCGACCSSIPVLGKTMRSAAPSGTAAPTWSTASPTAWPATANATRSAPTRVQASAAARSRRTTGTRHR
ncbi:MAG: cytochrome c [Rubrivivax sp.]